MHEFLALMRKEASPADVSNVASLISSMGGRITQRYPPRIIIGQGGGDISEQLRTAKGVVNIYRDPIPNPEALDLDQNELLVVQAWNTRVSEEYREAKAARPGEGEPWDRYTQTPRSCNIPVEDETGQSSLMMRGLAARAPATNTSRYLTGTVAVGIIIVDGPAGGTAAFTPQERTNVVTEVQEGANGLINMAPAGANLNFIYDINTVTLNLDPNTVTGEGQWRDPAMAALGYTSGTSGMYDYLDFLRTRRWSTICPGPDWAYIAFFTKYATFHFAYASINGPRLVMQYSNDGWGPNQIDRVFAHETGHIFGAPDEYTSSNCSTGGSWGYLGVANGNCAVGNPNSIDCIMKGNTYNSCQWTVGHFGWRDNDSDGTPDPIDLNPGTYRTDVGITPGSPFYNNSELWIRNQDDGEANQSHENPVSNLDNFIYARLRNFGSVTAEVVRTRFYLANFTGTEFVFPNDYTNIISAQDIPCPVTFSLTPGASSISKVRLQTQQIPSSTWHPCLLVHVESIQDDPVQPGTMVWQSNNLAQKNLVIEYAAPGQSLKVPIMIQNITAKKPFFEIRRTKVPAELDVAMEFPDNMLKPEIISVKPKLPHHLPNVVPINPVITKPIVSLPDIGKTPVEDENLSLKFLNDANISLKIPKEQKELFLHLVAGSSIDLEMTAASTTMAVTHDMTKDVSMISFKRPFEQIGRVFLPLPKEPITQFKLDVGPETRKSAGINFKVPAEANIGEEYALDLVQYDENEKPIGGITFLIRVVSSELVLKVFRERITILRDLATHTGINKLNDLASMTEKFIDSSLDRQGRAGRKEATGAAKDTPKMMQKISSVLHDLSKEEELWPSLQIAEELAASLGGTQRFSNNLDALSQLLYYTQERLQRKYET